MIDCESVFRRCIYKNHDFGRPKKKDVKLSPESEYDNPLTLMQQSAVGDGKEKWKQKIK